MTENVSFEKLLANKLEEPDFRKDWERTAYARAIAHQVLRYRVDHGLTQTALAKLLGVSQSVVGRLELGEHEPKISTLLHLSEKLGMRFLLDIHPVGQTTSTRPDVEGDTERVIVGSVEMLVSAS